MFILRMIGKDLIAKNYELSDNYSVISKHYNTEDYLNFCQEKQVISNLFDGIITDENGKFFPLDKDTHYYVMTESGKTFERLHF